MKTYFTLNNRRYEAREFDFNLICDLQEMGIDILEMSGIKNNPLPTIRAYTSLCVGADKEIAGEEIQAHVLNGGGFDEIMQAMQKKMEESDFFQALNKESEEKTPKPTPKKSKEIKPAE